jgi:TRAP-type C4-dicarboxylate transport system permease small subunit
VSTEKTSPKIVTWLENVAAGFLAAITVLTFVAVILRYIFSYVIPDSFDIARLLLGASIFWGIATANYRDEHIGMDLVWSLVSKRGKYIIDVIAGIVTLAVFGVFGWMFTFKFQDTLRSGETTFDLHVPLAFFYGLAWLGVAAGVVLLAIRVWRLIAHPEAVGAKGEGDMMLD